jgi:glutathione peroxidase
MRILLTPALVALTLTACTWKEVHVAPTPAPGDGRSTATAAPVIDHTVRTLSGETVSLSQYRGKALLIVNTASECGLTPQYQGLQALYLKYKDRGLEVLGFPCNDFGGQEPGSADQIQSFCSSKFAVTFPLFEKVRAKGDKSPLYKTLTEEIDPSLRGEIKWNFTKFLVNPQGQVVARFEPMVEPGDPKVAAEIDKVLPL